MRIQVPYMVGIMVCVPGIKDYIFDRKFERLEDARICFEQMKSKVDPHGPIVELRIYNLLDVGLTPLETYDGVGLHLLEAGRENAN